MKGNTNSQVEVHENKALWVDQQTHQAIKLMAAKQGVTIKQLLDNFSKAYEQ